MGIKSSDDRIEVVWYKDWGFGEKSSSVGFDPIAVFVMTAGSGFLDVFIFDREFAFGFAAIAFEFGTIGLMEFECC